MISVSVPGKIHLSGEHAVVYGRPALLAAINRRLTVSIAAQNHGVRIDATEDQGYIRHVMEVVKKHTGIAKLPGLTLTVTSEFPAGYHLGSSAAVAAGIVGALLYFLKKTWNPMLINQLAFEAEKKMHGNPSGGDNSAVVYGGFLWFRRELPFLRSFWQLPLRLPETLNHFFLIDTGRPKENTAAMVRFVQRQHQKSKAKYEKLFGDNEEQTKRIAGAIKEADEALLIHAMQGAERTLEAMGVVSGKVLPVIRAIEKAGGAAKILGGGGRAGGVGYLLCYHRSPKSLGLPCEPITLGEEGIRLEKKE